MATISPAPAELISDELPLGPDDAGRRLSRQEYAAAVYQEPFTYERVKGRLVVMSPAGPEHRGVSRPFRRELGGYWHTHQDLVDEVDVEGWLATSEDDDRIPDICVYLHGATSSQKVPDRVPDLVFEFVSASRADQERDYIHKREEYYAVGVKEYVIADRFKRTVLVLTHGKSDFDEQLLKPGEKYSTSLLPGLSVSIDEVFADE
jgi:Uma2 family endonuclease